MSYKIPSKEYIDTRIDSFNNGPKDVFDTVAELTSTNPDHGYIYLVLENGYWYFWDGEEWLQGGHYGTTPEIVQLKEDAQTAKTQAESARDLAVSAKDTAVTAKDNAVIAQGLAEDAKDEAQAIAGGVAGTYDTLVDLQTADPSHGSVYLVVADANWYYWDTGASDWLAGGVYSNEPAITSLNVRLDTLEGTGEGSVAKAIEDYAVKLTKMPDGATAVYSQDEWDVIYPWQPNSVIVSIVDGNLVFANNGGYYSETIPNASGKVCLMRIKRASAGAILLDFRVDGVYTTQKTFQANANEYTILLAQIPIGTTVDRVRFSGMSGVSSTLDWIWIGDYSYLENSLSTEASRIANQLGDTTGVGTKASGTITSNGTNVSDGDTVTIAGKVYTFKTTLSATRVEGEVKIGPYAYDTMSYLWLAINRDTPSSYDYDGSAPIYNCAEAHPLVTCAWNSAYINTITAKSTGLLGNSITLAKSAPTLTLSGSTLTGGTDDVGEKMRTQIASLNGQWITPTLVNGWKNYNPVSYQTCQYFKDVNGIVHLKGFIDAGTINTTIFVLPAGYRPYRIAYFAGVSNNAIASIAINNLSGNVTAITGSSVWVSLDGITFKAEA